MMILTAHQFDRLWLPLSALMLICASPGLAQNSKFPYYRNVDPIHQSAFTPPTLEAAKTALDSRPAEQDPDGNWGLPVEGFQMALRFPKTTYMLGEDVVGTNIVRNVTTNTVSFAFNVGKYFDIFISGPAGTETAKTNTPQQTPFAARLAQNIFAPKHFQLAPRTQRKFSIRVQDYKPITIPGQYVMTIRREVPKLDDPHQNADVLSGNAVIQVIPNPSARTDVASDTMTPGVPTNTVRDTTENTLINSPGQVGHPQISLSSTTKVLTPTDVDSRRPTVSMTITNTAVAFVLWISGAVIVLLMATVMIRKKGN